MDALDLRKTGELPEVEINLSTLKFAFQPIFDIHSGDVYGYEALMRPGNHTPNEVIQSYAKADMLDYIEEVTFHYASKSFFDAKLDGYLFLNTFPGSCMSLEVAEKTFAKYSSNLKNRLFLEVLEYTSWNPFAWNIKKRSLERAGIKPHFVIDDFGTGENFNIHCLRLYRPELVKIDRKYIEHIDSNRLHQEILDEMITYLHSCGIKVLAEGVERKSEYLYLMRRDIDYMQGFYLGKPRIYC